MAAILVFFCPYSNLPGLPRLGVKNSKEYFNLNEASQANLNTDKTILKKPPFMKVVKLASNKTRIIRKCNFLFP